MCFTACGEEYVTMTIPATAFEDMSEEDILKNAEEQEYKSCVVNEDGSVTYMMTITQRDEILNDYKISLDKTIANILEDSNFSDIKYNENLTQIDIYVDENSFSMFDMMTGFPFMAYGQYYQGILGVEQSEMDVVVNYIDNTSQKILESQSLRTFLDNSEESENNE